MDSSSPLHVSMFRQPNSGSRKRPFNVANSNILAEYSAENSEDYNILSSLGMKDKDIFQSPKNTSLLRKQDNDIAEKLKVPVSPLAVQSPYFNVDTIPTKPTAQDVQAAKPTDMDYEAKTTSNPPIVPKEHLPQVQLASNPMPQQENNDGTKSRKLRSIGEFTVSSLDKEYQEIIDFLKQEREQDQLLFLKCSEALRNKTESIIENLENVIRGRYQALDENLHSVINEFEKEWDDGRKLEEEVSTLKNQMSSIMNNILQDPGSE